MGIGWIPMDGNVAGRIEKWLVCGGTESLRRKSIVTLGGEVKPRRCCGEITAIEDLSRQIPGRFFFLQIFFIGLLL